MTDKQKEVGTKKIFGVLGIVFLGIYLFLNIRKQKQLQKINNLVFKEEYRIYLYTKKCDSYSLNVSC